MVPNFRCPSQVIGSQLLFNLATDWRFPLPSSPWTWLFARIAHRIQGNIFVYQFVKRYDKRYRWTASQIKRCTGWGLGGSWEQSLLSPWSWGRMRCVTLPVCRCVHQPGDSLDHILLGFYGGLIVWAWSIINSFSITLPISGATY